MDIWNISTNITIKRHKNIKRKNKNNKINNSGHIKITLLKKIIYEKICNILQ